MSGSALLIGYGSVGRYHAKALAARSTSLAIVDPKAAAREQAKGAHPDAVVVERLEDLGGRGFDWSGALAVIASWGPSHASVFHALADRGVRAILCEKPLASSVELADGMVRRADRDGIALAVHHYIRYARLARALRGLAQECGLGEPVSIVSEGGACCLLTNGIHLIDFAIELFGSDPESVISTARGEAINPRSPDLSFYGGSAIWSFPGGRESVIAFSNQSSLTWLTRVYFRDAFAEFGDSLEARVFARDRASVEKFPAITRTGRASQPVGEGALAGVLGFEDGIRGALDDVAQARPGVSAGSIGRTAVSACIGALLSSRERRAVDLPIDPASAAGRENWPIS